MEVMGTVWQWLSDLLQWLFTVNFQIIGLAGGAWLAMFLVFQIYRFLIAPFLGTVPGMIGVDDMASNRRMRHFADIKAKRSGNYSGKYSNGKATNSSGYHGKFEKGGKK